MSSERIIGTETEYGVYRPGDAWANPIALSTPCCVRVRRDLSLRFASRWSGCRAVGLHG